MNKIVEYVKSLLPVYERRDILTTLTQLQDELNTTLMPVVSDVRELFQGRTFTSKLYKDYEVRLNRHISTRQPAFELLLQSVERIQANFPFLEKEVRSNFGIQVATAGITYDSVNVLRYLDAVGFYIRYARKFLLKVVADESAASGGTQPNWIRAELDYLKDGLDNFAGLFVAVYKTESELKQTFRKVSSAVVDEATSDLAVKTLGSQKVDPMRLVNFTPQENWIFAIGKALTEWQVNRYRAAKEDLAALQMRLLEMRELQSTGKASPKMQKLITQLEERVEKLDAKLSKIEEEARETREV